MARIPTLHILDKNENFLTTLENTPRGKTFFEDKHTEILNNYESTFEFSCLADHPGIRDIKEDCKVVFRHRDGTFRMFTIMKSRRVKQDGIRYKRFIAFNSAIELLYKVVTPTTLSGYTVREAGDYVLRDTRWQLGEVEFAGSRTFTFSEAVTAIKALHQIRSEFGLDIRYRVEWRNGEIVGRYVDFIRLGQEDNFRFDNKRDLVEISDEVDIGPVYTAVYCYGPGDSEGNTLTIANAEWSKASGDPTDKPKGQLWVGDEEARQKWGLPDGRHRFGIYNYSGESQNLTPEQLLSNGWSFLQGRKEPKFSATANVVLLGRFPGYEHKQAFLGDTGVIKDTDFDPVIALGARITKMETSMTDPTKDRVTFGNYEPLVLTNIDQIKELQGKLRRKEKAWDSSVRYVRQPTPPTDTSVIWIDSSRESEGKPDIIKTYDEASGMWVKATPEVAEEVGAYTQSETDAKDQALYEDSTYYADQVAQAKAELARVQAEAYADGIVNEEEQARIADAEAKLQEAKQYAETQSQPGKDAKQKIDIDVGSDKIETTTRAQQKANSARDQAKQDVQDGRVPLPPGALQPGAINVDNNPVKSDTAGVYVDDRGILVNSGNFRLQDDITQIESLVRENANMINDHSFEMIPRGNSAYNAATFNVDTSKLGNYFWWNVGGTQSLARIQSTYGTDDFKRAKFGLQAAVVRDVNDTYWIQYVELNTERGIAGPYTLSCYFSAFEETTANTECQFVIQAYDWNFQWIADVASTSVIVKPNERYKWRRVSATATNLPSSTFYLRIRLNTRGGLALADGVQLVPFDRPIVYEAEEGIWKTLRSMAGYTFTDIVANYITAGGGNIGATVHQSLSLQNGWQNYGGDFIRAAYTKSADGFVHLRGLIRNGTIGAVCGTLPGGCRPYQTEIFKVATYGGNNGIIYVYDDGRVSIIDGHSSWVSLSGIVFRAEN